MNTIVNTNPPSAESFNPIFRPRAIINFNQGGKLSGSHPRPLLFIGREPERGLPSRRAMHLMDALFPTGWERLEHATWESEFGARSHFLRKQIGEGRRTSNDRLDAAFAELVRFQWRFPTALMSDVHTVNSIIGGWYKSSRLHIWYFTPEVVALCQNVPLWAPYPTARARSFEKPLVHRLHELLLVFANRQFPIWSVSTTEFLHLMGASAQVRASDRFLADKIVPAIAAIESIAPWQIRFERFPAPQVAPTQWVRFTIRRKPKRAR